MRLPHSSPHYRKFIAIKPPSDHPPDRLYPCPASEQSYDAVTVSKDGSGLKSSCWDGVGGDNPPKVGRLHRSRWEFILYFTPSVRWTFHRNPRRQFYIKVGGGYYRSALKANAFLVEKNWVSHSPGGHASFGIRFPTRHCFAWESDIQVHVIGFRRPEFFASQDGYFKLPIAFRVGVSIY